MSVLMVIEVIENVEEINHHCPWCWMSLNPVESVCFLFVCLWNVNVCENPVIHQQQIFLPQKIQTKSIPHLCSPTSSQSGQWITMQVQILLWVSIATRAVLFWLLIVKVMSRHTCHGLGDKKQNTNVLFAGFHEFVEIKFLHRDLTPNT